MKRNSVFDLFNALAEGVGFDSIGDFILSVTALRYWLVWIESLVVSGFLTIVALNYVEFVEMHLYAPEHAYKMYNISILLNLALGVLVARKVRKERFDFNKFGRAVVQGLGQNGALVYAFNLGKADEVYVWLPVTVWTMFTGLNFLKFLRNMSLLDWMQGEFSDLLIRQFSDKYQIKLKHKVEEDEQDDSKPTD